MNNLLALLLISSLLVACQTKEASFPSTAEMARLLTDAPLPSQAHSINLQAYQLLNEDNPDDLQPVLKAGIGYRTAQEQLVIFALSYRNDTLIRTREVWRQPISGGDEMAAGKILMDLSIQRPDVNSAQQDSCCRSLMTISLVVDSTRIVSHTDSFYHPLDRQTFPIRVLSGQNLPDDRGILLYTFHNHDSSDIDEYPSDIIYPGQATFFILQFMASSEEEPLLQTFADSQYPDRLFFAATSHPAGLMLTWSEITSFLEKQEAIPQ
jgi:hypothetical protein